MLAVTHFGVLGEDVVHQAFVPRPQRPAAAAHSCNKPQQCNNYYTSDSGGLSWTFWNEQINITDKETEGKNHVTQSQ